MSTRIHRAVGYGAVHPEGTKFRHRFHDERRHGEVSHLLEAEHAAMKAASEHDVGRAASMSFELPVAFENPSAYPGTFDKFVHYAEHPDVADGVWIIIPPSSRGMWYRLGDMMDYCDAMDRPNPTVTVLKWLDTPIYPYVDYMDAVTGVRLKDVLDEEARDVPGAVPMPPEAVAAIARHLGFDWKSLRPVIATWWC